MVSYSKEEAASCKWQTEMVGGHIYYFLNRTLVSLQEQQKDYFCHLATT